MHIHLSALQERGVVFYPARTSKPHSPPLRLALYPSLLDWFSISAMKATDS